MADGAVLEQLVAPLPRAHARGRPRPIIGTWTFSRAFSVGIRWWNWKTKPTVDGPVLGRVAEALEIRAADRDRARVGPVERADEVQQRALAAAGRA